MTDGSPPPLTAPAPTPTPEPRERLAALDVGSNSIRLLVAEYDPASGLTVIDEVKDQPRLAVGLATSGRLDPAAMERAFTAIQRMRDVCQRRGVSRITAVATAAVREAENGDAFVERIRAELGIPLRIIDSATEASLSYRSVAHHFQLDNARTLVADIGGGSLELIGAVNGLVEITASLPLGAVRMTETYLAGAKSPLAGIRKLRSQIRKQLRRELADRDWTAARVIGSGGTFTNLARMAVARRGGAVPEMVHGLTIGTAEVEHLLEWLATRTPDQRRAVPGLNPQRADIILAGVAVCAELLSLANARSITVSAFGLREGLLLEMAGAGAERRSDPLRLVREFAERCQSDRRHVEQVRHLALLLFDQIGAQLGAKPEERLLVEIAGLVHDVGQIVSYRRHHRHSFQLIMHADRLNLSAHDRLMVALVSRYHRKRGPRRSDEELAELTGPDRELVRRLSAMLRIADGLDRGHTAIVETIRAELTPDRLDITVVPRFAEADVSLECWGGMRKADVMAKLAKREVVIRAAARPG